MKKKLVTLVLTAMLSLGMATTVFAAPSPSANNSSGTPTGVNITYESTDGTDMIWISSQENGNISIAGSEASIPEGSSFSCKKIVSGAEYERAAKAVAATKGNVDFVVFDMNLKSPSGAAITAFDGHADISMPIPYGVAVSEGKTVSVYYLGTNGTLTKCNSVIDGNFITFGTTHLSTYVYIEESEASAAASTTSVKAPKTAENNAGVYVMLLAATAFGGVVCGTRKVKYNK